MEITVANNEYESSVNVFEDERRIKEFNASSNTVSNLDAALAFVKSLIMLEHDIHDQRKRARCKQGY